MIFPCWCISLLTMLSGKPAKDYYAMSVAEFFELEEVHRQVDPDRLDNELLEAAVFFASNEARVQKRKPLFRHDSSLQEAAHHHSAYMLEYEVIDHYNHHNKDLQTPFDRIQNAGGRDFRSVAENVARISVYDLGKRGEFYTNEKGEPLNADGSPLKILTYAGLARKVVNGWMKSKHHRDNLMGDYEYLGTGTAGSIVIRIIPEVCFTQNFGNK